MQKISAKEIDKKGEVRMERALIADLINWKEKPCRKPLILKGVRQCGKTYLLKAFGEQCYDSFAYFNFEETEALKTVFEKRLRHRPYSV